MYCGHDERGYCPITDKEIDSALPFIEHDAEFSIWGHLTGSPNWDKSKNAYHIKYLADIMEKKGWIGPPAQIWIGPYREGQPLSGNHRIRAIKYLKKIKNITIPMKIEFCEENDSAN